MSGKTITSWNKKPVKPHIGEKMKNDISQKKQHRLSADTKLIRSLMKREPQTEEELCKNAGVKIRNFRENRRDLLIEEKIIKRLPDGSFVLWEYEPLVSIQRYDASDIVFLIKVLENENLPQNIKESAGYSLRDCCSGEGEIEGGKDELRLFFIDILEGLDNNERKELTQVQIKYALEYYIAFQLKDEEDILWMKMSCFPKLISVFKDSKNIEERKRVLKILSRIYEVEQLYKQQMEFDELLGEKFFDADEDESIARDCWDIIWRQAEGEERETLINELFTMAKSEDERLKKRGLKHLENIIGEVRGSDSKKPHKLYTSTAR